MARPVRLDHDHAKESLASMRFTVQLWTKATPICKAGAPYQYMDC